MVHSILRITAISVFLWNFAYGQGCSDAGFCTMGAMKPDQPFNKKVEFKLRSMELSFYRGTTTASPIVYVATADLNFSLGAKTFFQVKVPYQAVEGNFDKTSGLSDLSLSITRVLKDTEKYDISFTLGGKIPSSGADLNRSTDGAPLPMYYQVSLGSYDLVSGISFKNRNWLVATGIQYAFTQNDNNFTREAWREPVYPDFNYVRKHDDSGKLRRGTDVMLRVERNFRFSQFNFSLGALPIFRITQDEIEDPVTGLRAKQQGTTGMALSAIATVGYSFDVRSGIRLLLGQKITQREVNPDGLTRNMVSTLSYYYRF